MKVFNAIEKIPTAENNLVVTLGNFDGVHKGHQVLIEELLRRKSERQGKGLVFTFSPHPRAILYPDKGAPPRLTTREERVKLLETAGVDYLLFFPFSREIAELSAWEFTNDFLHNGLKVREVIIGPNFRFGHNRQGTTDLLRRWGEELGFLVQIVEPVISHGEVVSSSRIRQLIVVGEMAAAAEFLGYNYFISGRVIKGAARGRELGFPTINMELPEKLVPASGVYATKANINDKWRLGVTNLGIRPTFHEKELTLETHFPDYDGVNPPQNLTLHFLKKIRDEQTFNSVEALKLQIQKDINSAKNK